MTAADELRAAADRLDTLTGATTEGPWTHAQVKVTRDWNRTAAVHQVQPNNLAIVGAGGDAEYIAAMGPVVGKAIAVLLREYSELAEEHDIESKEEGAYFSTEEMYAEELAVARAINASAS
jgi:hypothetical protein